MSARCLVMTGIVFRVQVDTGRGNVGVPQVVAHGLDVHAVALVGAGCVAHPVR